MMFSSENACFLRAVTSHYNNMVTGTTAGCDDENQQQTNMAIFKYYLFIYAIFNDALSTSDCIASNDRMISE
jgi:hypothetical protein